MNAGKRVKALREEKRWSQGFLGERAGVDSSYISLLETGKRENPGVDTLNRLAQALGTSIAYLVGETDDPRPLLGPGQAAHNATDPYGDSDITPEDIQDAERFILEVVRRRKERRRLMDDGNGGPEKQ